MIWSEYDGTTIELSSLAREAEQGDAYCSRSGSELISDPAEDEAWDGTEFFGVDEDEDEDEDGIPWADKCTTETPCPVRAAQGGASCGH